MTFIVGFFGTSLDLSIKYFYKCQNNCSLLDECATDTGYFLKLKPVFKRICQKKHIVQ